VIDQAKTTLRLGKTLFRGLAVPFHRLGIILWHTVAFAIHVTKIELSHGMSLFGLGAGFGKRR